MFDGVIELYLFSLFQKKTFLDIFSVSSFIQYFFIHFLTIISLTVDESGDQHVTSKRKSFRTIHTTKGIKEILSIEKTENPSVPFMNTPLPPMNLEKIEETVEKALEERKRKLGQGVGLHKMCFRNRQTSK